MLFYRKLKIRLPTAKRVYRVEPIFLIPLEIAKVGLSEIVKILTNQICERVTGIEPVSCPWEGHVMPLYHTRGITNF